MRRIGLFFSVTSVLFLVHLIFTQNWQTPNYKVLRAKKTQSCDFDVVYAWKTLGWNAQDSRLHPCCEPLILLLD